MVIIKRTTFTNLIRTRLNEEDMNRIVDKLGYKEMLSSIRIPVTRLYPDDVFRTNHKMSGNNSKTQISALVTSSGNLSTYYKR